MIGTVERRNSVLRRTLEKLIASSTTDQLELLLAPALHAVNSSTFTRARTTFQAVPGGLMTDETALATSHRALDQPDNVLAKSSGLKLRSI